MIHSSISPHFSREKNVVTGDRWTSYDQYVSQRYVVLRSDSRHVSRDVSCIIEPYCLVSVPRYQ